MDNRIEIFQEVTEKRSSRTLSFDSQLQIQQFLLASGTLCAVFRLFLDCLPGRVGAGLIVAVILAQLGDPLGFRFKSCQKKNEIYRETVCIGVCGQ